MVTNTLVGLNFKGFRLILTIDKASLVEVYRFGPTCSLVKIDSEILLNSAFKKPSRLYSLLLRLGISLSTSILPLSNLIWPL